MGRRGFWTNDGGSAHTASFTDALSSDISRFTMEAGRNRKRFPASPPGSVKSSAYCASTRHSLFTLPSLPFSLILCYVLLHRPVPEGYGRIIRRLGSGKTVVVYFISDSDSCQIPVDIQTAFAAHVVRAAACERGYTYSTIRCRNKVKKSPALCSHKKRDFF